MDIPRPFLVHLADGTVWQGAQFHTGFVCVVGDRPGEVHPYAYHLAVDMEHLLADFEALHGARIEWADSTEEAADAVGHPR